jgi:hypothetical protein
VYRYTINKGEAIVTFDPSFKIFNLVLDFKILNCQGVRLIIAHEFYYREMVGFQISLPSYF